MSKGTTIFIDAQDMEERYGEELYKEYLEKENKQLKEVIEEVREVINKMIHTGYVASNGDGYSATQYMATNEHSEFGIRAKVLLQILDKAKENKQCQD